jgi:CheY-like chemotaxis protein
LNGLEVAEAIRARGCATPIVMISDGQAEPADQQRAVEAGLRFVRQPITLAQFEATIAAIASHTAAE